MVGNGEVDAQKLFQFEVGPGPMDRREYIEWALSKEVVYDGM